MQIYSTLEAEFLIWLNWNEQITLRILTVFVCQQYTGNNKNAPYTVDEGNTNQNVPTSQTGPF